MREKHFVLPSAKEISIGPAAAERIIASGSGNAALLYIYILKNSGSICFETASRDLKMPLDQVISAMKALGKMELVIAPDNMELCDKPKPAAPLEEASPPEYTAAYVNNEIEKNNNFKQLVNETQRRLGKVLSSADLASLFGLYDYLGLPVEVLCILVTHCVEEARRRYGEGRMPTMRQIEREAYVWSRNGVDTDDLAAQYLKKLGDRRGKMSEITKVLQISGRALSKSEEKYIGEWIEMGFGPEEIELAYDRTIIKTNALSWGYLNSIIKNWHEKGLHKISEIQSGDKQEKKQKPVVKSREYSNDDINWMKNFVKKKKNQETR